MLPVAGPGPGPGPARLAALVILCGILLATAGICAIPSQQPLYAMITDDPLPGAGYMVPGEGAASVALYPGPGQQPDQVLVYGQRDPSRPGVFPDWRVGSLFHQPPGEPRFRLGGAVPGPVSGRVILPTATGAALPGFVLTVEQELLWFPTEGGQPAGCHLAGPFALLAGVAHTADDLDVLVRSADELAVAFLQDGRCTMDRLALPAMWASVPATPVAGLPRGQFILFHDREMLAYASVAGRLEYAGRRTEGAAIRQALATRLGPGLPGHFDMAILLDTQQVHLLQDCQVLAESWLCKRDRMVSPAPDMPAEGRLLAPDFRTQPAGDPAVVFYVPPPMTSRVHVWRLATDETPVQWAAFRLPPIARGLVLDLRRMALAPGMRRYALGAAGVLLLGATDFLCDTDESITCLPVIPFPFNFDHSQVGWACAAGQFEAPFMSPGRLCHGCADGHSVLWSASTTDSSPPAPAQRMPGPRHDDRPGHPVGRRRATGAVPAAMPTTAARRVRARHHDPRHPDTGEVARRVLFPRVEGAPADLAPRQHPGPGAGVGAGGRHHPAEAEIRALGACRCLADMRRLASPLPGVGWPSPLRAGTGPGTEPGRTRVPRVPHSWLRPGPASATARRGSPLPEPPPRRRAGATSRRLPLTSTTPGSDGDWARAAPQQHTWPTAPRLPGHNATPGRARGVWRACALSVPHQGLPKSRGRTPAQIRPRHGNVLAPGLACGPPCGGACDAPLAPGPLPSSVPPVGRLPVAACLRGTLAPPRLAPPPLGAAGSSSGHRSSAQSTALAHLPARRPRAQGRRRRSREPCRRRPGDIPHKGSMAVAWPPGCRYCPPLPPSQHGRLSRADASRPGAVGHRAAARPPAR
ncbi:hypothetical protein H696_05403 [Fonticula alba]|uniref:Uncharacterized protein n=1 Tax=Fonticula alba TaxID=691883 RepID=A0A058Z1I1_FONAL|nr:hypothetical protein H696_05403 [Fonticula alba]KCV68139.1 hypothetical protein H696_05403 [Fonticula alba]|eukprot:XP_009497513.1 hypothetical protein H696_05403 [Fonticula alba]